MGWIDYILFYYFASSFLATFFLIIKYGEKNPKINASEGSNQFPFDAFFLYSDGVNPVAFLN